MKEIEKTKWAKKFKELCPSQYDKAIQYATDPSLKIDIYRTNESGEWVWAMEAIVNEKSTNFWFGGFETKKDALMLCKIMNWRVA